MGLRTNFGELIETEAVPFLPVLRYKATGLRKREVWISIQRGDAW